MPFLSEAGTDGALPVLLVEPAPEAGADVAASTTSGAMRFVCLPAGYEFSTLIADIVDVSRGTVALSQTTQDELRGLDQDLHLQVFVTPTLTGVEELVGTQPEARVMAAVRAALSYQKGIYA